MHTDYPNVPLEKVLLATAEIAYLSLSFLWQNCYSTDQGGFCDIEERERQQILENTALITTLCCSSSQVYAVTENTK